MLVILVQFGLALVFQDALETICESRVRPQGRADAQDSATSVVPHWSKEIRPLVTGPGELF